MADAYGGRKNARAAYGSAGVGGKFGRSTPRAPARFNRIPDRNQDGSVHVAACIAPLRPESSVAGYARISHTRPAAGACPGHAGHAPGGR